MRSGTITTTNTGVDLAYRMWEGDGPPIVLVHGLASSMRIWDYVAPRLAEHFTVVAYDQRGHGASSSRPLIMGIHTGYDLHTMVADLHDLVDALYLEEPFLVGHSWGATLVLGYAAQYPQAVPGIALVDGGTLDFHDFRNASWESVARNLAPPDLSGRTLNDMVEKVRNSPHFSDLSEEQIREYFSSIMEEQPDGTIRARLRRENHMRILRTMWDTRPAELFPRIECPVLVVQAERSAGNDAELQVFVEAARHAGVERARRLLKDVKVVEVPEAVHDIPLHKPNVLAHELSDFFTECCSDRSLAL